MTTGAERADAPPRMRFAADLLAGKVALVTGGGTGIGKVTAIEMARCGGAVALYGRRLEKLEETAAEIAAVGGRALPIQGDTRDTDQLQAAMDAIRAEFGRLDILVNNAGGQFVSRARDIDFKGFDAVIRNNLSATWYVTKLAADNFFFEGGGRVICVTAPVRAALPGFSHSGAARAGVASLMKSLAYEWAEYGILCNCVGPGSVKSFEADHYPIPIENWMGAKRNLLGRMGRTEDVSGAIIFLASELGDYITGEELYVDGGETLYLHNDAADLVAPDLVETRRAAGREKRRAR